MQNASKAKVNAGNANCTCNMRRKEPKGLQHS